MSRFLRTDRLVDEYEFKQNETAKTETKRNGFQYTSIQSETKRNGSSLLARIVCIFVQNKSSNLLSFSRSMLDDLDRPISHCRGRTVKRNKIRQAEAPVKPGARTLGSTLQPATKLL